MKSLSNASDAACLPLLVSLGNERAHDSKYQTVKPGLYEPFGT